VMIHRCQILKADLKPYQPKFPIWTSVSHIIRVRVLDKQRICHQGRPNEIRFTSMQAFGSRRLGGQTSLLPSVHERLRNFK
jgi:hypothetical protein